MHLNSLPLLLYVIFVALLAVSGAEIQDVVTDFECSSTVVLAFVSLSSSQVTYESKFRHLPSPPTQNEADHYNNVDYDPTTGSSINGSFWTDSVIVQSVEHASSLTYRRNCSKEHHGDPTLTYAANRSFRL